MTTLTTTQLTAIGVALYGTQWQSDLARALSVDSRRVRQWLNNERPIPEWLQGELITLLSADIDECQRLQMELSMGSNQ